MSKIEWCEDTWNCVVGCSLVSPGCTNCYAMKQAARIVNMYPGSHYAGTVQGINGRHPTWTGKLVVAPDHIFDKPLKRRKPTLYFVNSMSDLFHEGVEDATIDRVFAIMALRGDHRFQILTKRHDRMKAYIDRTGRSIEFLEKNARDLGWTLKFDGHGMVPWPLPNVWLGVSVEDQRRANERIPALLKTPAAVRFLSVEPMLGPIELDDIVTTHPTGMEDHHSALDCDVAIEDDEEFGGAVIDWVICGGESGPGARLFNLAWARALRDQCNIAGTPFFMKQCGSKPVGNSFPFKHSKGGDMEEWPEDLRVRQMPESSPTQLGEAQPED